MWAQSQILATLRNMHMSCKYHSLFWMISCTAPLIDFVELVWVPHTPRVAVKYISWQVERFRWRRCPKRCLLKGPSTVLHLWTSTPVLCCSATHQICAHPVQVWILNAELIKKNRSKLTSNNQRHTHAIGLKVVHLRLLSLGSFWPSCLIWCSWIPRCGWAIWRVPKEMTPSCNPLWS